MSAALEIAKQVLELSPSTKRSGNDPRPGLYGVLVLGSMFAVPALAVLSGAAELVVEPMKVALTAVALGGAYGAAALVISILLSAVDACDEHIGKRRAKRAEVGATGKGAAMLAADDEPERDAEHDGLEQDAEKPA